MTASLINPLLIKFANIFNMLNTSFVSIGAALFFPFR